TKTDMAVFLRLKRIFPGLTAWSTGNLSALHRSREKITRISENNYEEYLATSTLALDLIGASPGLAADSAKAGVPCISVDRDKQQVSFWPDLTIRSSNITTAMKLAHWMLTDQGDAAEVCAIAQKRWREQRIGKKKRQDA